MKRRVFGDWLLLLFGRRGEPRRHGHQEQDYD